MKPGANLTPEILSSIESSDLFLCVLSTDYFDSEWCKNELKHAIKHGKKLFPIEWVGKFFLPTKFESQLKDILRRKYHPKAINEKAETRKCVNEVISVIGQLMNTVNFYIYEHSNHTHIIKIKICFFKE